MYSTYVSSYIAMPQIIITAHINKKHKSLLDMTVTSIRVLRNDIQMEEDGQDHEEDDENLPFLQVHMLVGLSSTIHKMSAHLSTSHQ
jgi:hypothetical protein